MRTILLPLALAACAPAAAPTTVSTDVVAQEIAGRLAGPTQACIDAAPNENIRALDAATVAYDRGPVIWVNRLSSACPGIQPGYRVATDSPTGQFCRGDHVRGLDQGPLIPGPVCFLGDWTPYRIP